MASEKWHMAFVYGSLKRSHRNADLMNDESKGIAIFLGRGQTATKYPLVVATEYNAPFLLKVPGQGHEILGEIYEIDDAKLEFLDKFEGHPNFFRREEILVQLMEDADGQPITSPKEVKCSAYFLCEVKEDFLKLEWLREFTPMPEDKLPYPIRNHRTVPLKSLVFPEQN